MTKENTQEESIFRTMLRSEVTWVVCILGLGWSFVGTVVLPLQKLQIQLTEVQNQLIQQSTVYSKMASQIQSISSKQQVDESRIETLFNKQF